MERDIKDALNESIETNEDKVLDANKKEKKKNRVLKVIIIAIIIIIILLCMRCCCTKKAPTTSHSVTIDTSAEDKRDEKKVNPLAGRDVYFSGIVDSEISKNGSIQLLNDERNEDFYMMFTVIDSSTGDVIYESNLVPSGQAIYWVPGEYLDEGTYNLNFKETPFYFPSGSPEINPDDYITLSVGNNTVTITIV